MSMADEEAAMETLDEKYPVVYEDEYMAVRVNRPGDRKTKIEESRFLPGLVAESFDWLIDEYGFDFDPMAQPYPGSNLSLPPQPAGWPFHTADRVYTSHKTIVTITVFLSHGCGAFVDLAVAGMPKDRDALADRLRARGLVPPPTVDDFRRVVQRPRDGMNGAEWRALVASALTPVAQALRQLGPHELSGDWTPSPKY